MLQTIRHGPKANLEAYNAYAAAFNAFQAAPNEGTAAAVIATYRAWIEVYLSGDEHTAQAQRLAGVLRVRLDKALSLTRDAAA